MNGFLQEEFIKIGCKSPKNIAIGVQVYLELCEVKKYWDVAYNYSEQLEKLYFTAKKGKNQDTTVFLPIPISETVSFNHLEKYFSLCENLNKKAICLVIVHSDSTCVYYEASEGLLEPSSFSTKTKDDDSEKIDAVLHKNINLLKEAAMCGIAITIPIKHKEEMPKLEK